MKYDIDNRPTLLEEGDEVEFAVFHRGSLVKLVYLVIYDHLSLQSRSSEYRENDTIFHFIGIKSVSCKREFAKTFYGYDKESGDWPCAIEGDFPALTRLTNAIFDVIAGINKIA